MSISLLGDLRSAWFTGCGHTESILKLHYFTADFNVVLMMCSATQMLACCNSFKMDSTQRFALILTPSTTSSAYMIHTINDDSDDESKEDVHVSIDDILDKPLPLQSFRKWPERIELSLRVIKCHSCW